MADPWDSDPIAGPMLRPAIKTPSGIRVGDAGDSHDDLGEGGEKPPESRRGFVDSRGNFLDREQAAKVAKGAGLDVPDKLHSSDLAKAMPWEKDPAAPSPVARFMSGQSGPDTRSIPERVGEGARDPLEGSAQLLARIVPAPVERGINAANNWLADKTGLVARLPEGGMDEYERQREAEIQRERGGAAGTTDWWRIAGNVLSPMNYVPAARLGAGGNALARIGTAALGGAMANAEQPVTQGDFWSEKAKQAAIGAATGGVVGAAGEGVSKALAPKFRSAAQLLLDEGVSLTPGQLAGRAAKAAEDKATSVPILGDAIASAQRKSIDTFNRAALNRTLEPIAEKMPAHLTAGREAVAYAGDRISAVYDRVLPTVQLRADEQLAADLRGLGDLAAYMPPAQREQLAGIVNNRVLGRFTAGGMDGVTLQGLRSELRNFVRRYSSSSDAAQRDLADAIATVDLHLGQAVERQNPAQSGALRAADSAWARLVRVEGAAGRRSIAEGRFTPGDLLASIKQADKTARRRAFGRGDALMQDLADAAQNVIGNRYPDSGTAGRALFAGGLATMMGHPEAVLGLGAGAAPYTSPGINLLRRYAAATPGPLRNALAGAVRKSGPFLAPGAALGTRPYYQP